MRNLLLVLVIGWACGGGQPAPASSPVSNTVPPPPIDAAPPSGFEAAMAAMTHFADEMCACHDTSCAQRVADEMTKWSQEMAKDQSKPPKMTDDDVKRATALGERMGKCMQEAMGGGQMGSAATP